MVSFLPNKRPLVAAAGTTAMLAPSPAPRSHSRREDIRAKSFWVIGFPFLSSSLLKNPLATEGA